MIVLSELPYTLLVTPAVILGLLFGSFLNVVIYRLPRQQSVSFPGSQCPACHSPIRAYDNVPVLSWALLRGKARCCAAPISARYPLVEALGGLLAWAIVESIVLPLPGETPWWYALLAFAAHLALGLGMIALAFIDVEHMILPDEITIGGALLGLATLPLRPEVGWDTALLGGAIGFAIIWLPFIVLYSLVRGQPGMGLGDAKLLMLAGTWFGWQGALFTLLAGAVQGTVAALVVFMVQGRIEEPEAVREERAQMQLALDAAQGEERDALEREFAQDPIFREAKPGLGQARIPFGPFLALAVIEFMLLEPLIREMLWL